MPTGASRDPVDGYYLNDDHSLTDRQKQVLSAAFGPEGIPDLRPGDLAKVVKCIRSNGLYADANSIQLPGLMREAINAFLRNFGPTHGFDGIAAWNSPYSPFALIMTAVHCTTPGTKGALRMALLVEKILVSACKFASAECANLKSADACIQVQVHYHHLTQAVEEAFPALFEGGMVPIMLKIFNSDAYMGGCGICGAVRWTVEKAMCGRMECTRVTRFKAKARSRSVSFSCPCMLAMGHAVNMTSVCPRVRAD